MLKLSVIQQNPAYSNFIAGTLLFPVPLSPNSENTHNPLLPLSGCSMTVTVSYVGSAAVQFASRPGLLLWFAELNRLVQCLIAS
jgi:hypothetical protein